MIYYIFLLTSFISIEISQPRFLQNIERILDVPFEGKLLLTLLALLHLTELL